MKTVENVRLKVAYTVEADGKELKKNKTFNNIALTATDENLKACGDAVGTFIEGSNKRVIRMEEAVVL
ncbi:DUF1659 domain-containing protein [Gallicola sp. Sow4_E12]|uniref:DUF1659 domain-containing protein n=1 Tax=Gallicola sp. Sow4_E12 TaxID=3438785 RepID=UPI003F91AA6B